MKTLLAALLAVGALSAGFAPSGSGARIGYAPTSFLPHAGMPSSQHVAKFATQLGCGSITCDAYEAGVNGFLQDVAAASGANNVYSVATQYYDTTGNIAYNETFGGTLVDTNFYPTTKNCKSPGGATICLTKLQLENEIYEDATAKQWALGPNSLFVILLPAGIDTCGNNITVPPACASNNFCAYHAVGSEGYDHELIFAVEPFTADFFCGGAGQGYPNGEEIDKTVNTLSHEEIEAMTDPGVLEPNNLHYAWMTGNSDFSGDEIGDLCAWGFGNPLGTTPSGQPYNQVINGHDYSLQQEYSNADGGCVQYLGGPTGSITNGGTGPLNYHGGPVMHSVTVYAIYWIPIFYDPTANTDPPVVSGAAGVGQHLQTTTGTWTNSAGTFRYRWQRCDSNGANCVTIPNVLTTGYTVHAADIGHTIRSGVWALNGAGWAPGGYAASAPTAVVVGRPGVISKPVISGTPTIGMQLSVNTGSWTYSPTGYAYHWLRCGALGGSCVAISGISSTHTLKAADAGHTLKATVTATNVAGSRTVTTAASAVVTK